MTKAATNHKPPLLGAIWAQTTQDVIGRDGKMPWRVPEDLAHFKKVTAGKPVIMGRKTWESLPDNHKPLPGRVNIIVSRSVGTVEAHDGAIWVPNLDVALQEADKARQSSVSLADGDGQVHSLVDTWIIGGGTLYTEALSRDDLPRYGRVSIAEVTFLAPTSLMDVPGDTFAPSVVGWGIASESLPQNSGTGSIQCEGNVLSPAVYCFMTFTRDITDNMDIFP